MQYSLVGIVKNISVNKSFILRLKKCFIIAEPTKRSVTCSLSTTIILNIDASILNIEVNPFKRYLPIAKQFLYTQEQCFCKKNM